MLALLGPDPRLRSAPATLGGGVPASCCKRFQSALVSVDGEATLNSGGAFDLATV